MAMADNVLLGRLYSATILGTYVIAYNLAVLPLHGIGVAIVNVTFPAYAEIADERASGKENSPSGRRLERAFVRVFAASSTLLTVTAAVLLLLGDEIIIFLYGRKWIPAGTILRILAVLVFCKGHGILVSPLVVSLRGLAPDAKIKMIEAAIFLALLYPLTSRYGALGAAWAGAIAFFVMMVNRLRVAAALLPNIAGVLVRTVFSAAVACAAATALGALAIDSVARVSARLLLGGSVIAIVATGVMLVLSAPLRAELSRLLAAAKQSQNRER
jgi:O-antigen/teichoic acid export membrane protein